MIDSLPAFTDFKYKIFPSQSGGTRQPMATVFPLQLTDHGGPHLATVQNHDVFVNTTAAAVGNPQTFQANFSSGTFAHVLDQYVGSTAANRYPVNATLLSATISIFSNMISQNELFTVLHSALAPTHLSGNGHIYNLHTPGCGDDISGLTLPNAVPVDDNATALSHEESEAVTDPDSNGWFNVRATETLAGHTFLIQPEYSNAAGACCF